MRNIIILTIFILSANFIWAQNWISLGTGLDFQARILYPDSASNKLFIGGNFRHVNGHNDMGIVAWNGNTFDTLDGGIAYSVVMTIINYHNNVYVGGAFPYLHYDSTYHTRVNGFTKWNGSSFDSINIAFHNGSPDHFCEFNNLLYCVHSGDSVGNCYSPAIVAWDGGNWIPIGIPNYLAGSIGAMCIFQNSLYVAGTFQDSIGNLVGCAKFDGTNWTEVGIGGLGLIKGMVVYNNELYIGGQFVGVNSKNLVKYDGINFTDMNLKAGDVKNLRVIENKLFAVGSIDSAGGLPIHHNIAVWDGNNWSAFSSDTISENYNGMDGTISDVSVFNNHIYITGGFNYINSDTVYNIATYNGYYVGEKEVKEKGGVSVYPNPANSTIKISLSNSQLSTLNSQFTITDVLGNEVYKQRLSALNTNIDVSHWCEGVYFYRVSNDKGITSGKFVILR